MSLLADALAVATACAVVFVVLFPFFVMLVAKLAAYGWAAGRHRFEQSHHTRTPGPNPDQEKTDGP